MLRRLPPRRPTEPRPRSGLRRKTRHRAMRRQTVQPISRRRPIGRSTSSRPTHRQRCPRRPILQQGRPERTGRRLSFRSFRRRRRPSKRTLYLHGERPVERSELGRPQERNSASARRPLQRWWPPLELSWRLRPAPERRRPAPERRRPTRREQARRPVKWIRPASSRGGSWSRSQRDAKKPKWPSADFPALPAATRRGWTPRLRRPASAPLRSDYPTRRTSLLPARPVRPSCSGPESPAVRTRPTEPRPAGRWSRWRRTKSADRSRSGPRANRSRVAGAAKTV